MAGKRTNLQLSFYYRVCAKRGIAIACRLSVCLSVTLVNCDQISWNSDPLHVWFQGGVFGDGGSTGAISGSNKSKMATAAILKKIQIAISPQPVVGKISSGDISATGRPIHFMGRVFGDGGSNGAIFDSNKFKMAAAAILYNFEWPYLRKGSRSTYIARIARSSLR